MKEFLKLLIGASEKAANIARIIRADQELFSLLVEEKKEEEKNVRFVQDFKTLADVLIQETLRWEISKRYPEMKDSIFGEESNIFTNGIGESITVQIKENVSETAKLLTAVMGEYRNSSNRAMTILAEEIHRQLDDHDTEVIPQNIADGITTTYENLGVWIDPIDATNEYINGSQDAVVLGDEEKVCESGLYCVTVLIGVFQLHSGVPVFGVINQPFYTKTTPTDSLKKWKGRVIWGISHAYCLTSNIHKLILGRDDESCKLSLIISASEDSSLMTKLGKHFNLIVAAGAGYKLLAVILGLVDGYVLSKDTTHFWDTCGPHSILTSIGGGIIRFHEFMSLNQVEELQDISYAVNNTKFANLGGIIAYRNKITLELLRKCLK